MSREQLIEEATNESARRWPSPNSGLYEGLTRGFVLGATWAVAVTDAKVTAMTDPNSITDEQADAAQLAHYRFVFGEEGLPNRRELGISRQAMKVAISEAIRAAFTAGQEDKP